MLKDCCKRIIGASNTLYCGGSFIYRLRYKYLVCLSFCVLVVFSYCEPCTAQVATDSNELFSPSVGQEFYEIAHKTAHCESITKSEAKQAIIFLTASAALGRTTYVLPDMIKLVRQNPEEDYSQAVRNLLNNYIDETTDLEVTRKAIRYLLDRLNSREERERLLDELSRKLGGKSIVLDSELATLLGLLMVEKSDLNTAVFYFMQAYNSNKHNKLAFARLAELAPTQMQPVINLEHLRLILGENPLNIEAAAAFAQYAEQLQLYDISADAYEYCVDLFSYLYPAEPPPAQLYVPWALSNYNTQRSYHKCQQIVSDYRKSGRFNLLLEAIAAKAAMKIGNTEQANQMLRAIEDEALRLVNSPLRAVNYEELAWFYCFILKDANKAIDWANKAYSAKPNSIITGGLLAYSLAMNSQTDWAKSLVDNYKNSQIALLAMAQIQLAGEDKAAAIETLKSAIAGNPGTLEAEEAKEILARNGGEYVAAVNPDIIATGLRTNFLYPLVPIFSGPEKLVSVRLNVKGSKFSYGSDLGGSVAITNNSSEPLVISDDGLFTGNIRVDANISGDLNKKIADLVSVKIRPALPIEPGRSVFVPLQLVTGELKQTLLSYPQASLDIEFTVYLDPVNTEQGLTNRLADIKPERVIIKRSRVELTGKYLQNRVNSLSKGQQGQKIKAAQLFTGLLMEQHAMANRPPLYNFIYADWMPELLKSALSRNLTDDDWVVRVHTMAGMTSLSLDYELIGAVAENLNDTHWPTRLMAIYLLSKNQSTGFSKVLDWTARYDSNKLVRDMAIALGGTRPREKAKEPSTQSQPSDTNSLLQSK